MAKLKHITKYHERALELKYKGYSYQNIAEDINHRFQKSRKAKFTEQTIKDWFKEAGTLYETYRLYAQELDLIHQETVDIVRKAGVRVREQNFRLANEMLVALMGSQQDNVKLAAIKELLDRVEGHPKDRIELSKLNFSEMSPGDRWEFIPYEMQLALARNQYPDAKAAIIKKWLADGKPAVGNSSLADEQD